jgi:hypothetical protein
VPAQKKLLCDCAELGFGQVTGKPSSDVDGDVVGSIRVRRSERADDFLLEGELFSLWVLPVSTPRQRDYALEPFLAETA